MSDPSCWLSIIGIGEDGLSGLASPAQSALAEADIVFGGPRHLALADIGDRGRAWPTPFTIAPLMAVRGTKAAALVSGDPFWFGAGSIFARELPSGEWRAFAAQSCFSLAASRLGWPLETIPSLGLHAAPYERVRPHLIPGARLFCLLRDGAAPGELATYLVRERFGASMIHVLERLGGPAERMRSARAEDLSFPDIMAPVMVALEIAGAPGLPRSPGLPDGLFAHDGQITKAPMRALTLSALAPRKDERLWDIGAGSGSISVEWCLAGGKAIAIEARVERAVNIRANAMRFGLSQEITLVEGLAPAILSDLPAPDAIFIGGGADEAMLDAVWIALRPGGRLVVNAVTLETESLIVRAQAKKGGALLKVELSNAAPLGSMRGWQASRPLVQWSVVK
jgi:precorrin-6B C5,15-methyltransferase / cobalt-precorrin-6B C5,C15-methyltransferase